MRAEQTNSKTFINSPEGHAERNRLLESLNANLRKKWNFGSNALVGWRPVEGGIYYLAAPTLMVFGPAQLHHRIVNGGRLMGARTFEEIGHLLETEAKHFSFNQSENFPAPVSPADINDIFNRYTITQTRKRAVFLHDIAGFSLFTPEEQAAQLSTLEY